MTNFRWGEQKKTGSNNKKQQNLTYTRCTLLMMFLSKVKKHMKPYQTNVELINPEQYKEFTIFPGNQAYYLQQSCLVFFCIN